MTALHPPLFLLAAEAGHGEQRIVIFFAQVLLLVVVGRLLSEWMQRVRQPAVVGQLLAGILLGPSVFGAFWPAAQQLIFPASSSDRQMLNAVSELGVLLLLLLTGMETDLALVKRVRRSAAITSAAGILVPFACGYALGEALPDSILPDPNRRLLASLFLATALSISSVKIVAAVLREVDYLRRDLGQIILAAAILDDTMGWTILAFIGGLATQGRIVIGPVLFSILGTVGFLAFCFTIGRHWIAKIIRWTNDNFVIEMPVISVILVIAIGLALITNFIGVHTLLGAFMAGIMIGQSPILTKHIEEQLRGLIVALFMPIFFGVAGLAINLGVLRDPYFLELALVFIGIASVGKLGGCYLGSRLARLNPQEALAVGVAMNARGSTEVILATIGLTMGVLNQQLFTLIVLMAVVTTVCMPPLLRWALARVPIRAEEEDRLKTEIAEEKDVLPKLERVLVGVDCSDNGVLASRLAGWLIGARRVSASVMELKSATEGHESRSSPSHWVIEAAETAARSINPEEERRAPAENKRDDPIADAAKEAESDRLPIRELVSILHPKTDDHKPRDISAEAVLAEARKGYALLFLGLGPAPGATKGAFSPAIEEIIHEFSGHVAIALHGGNASRARLERILVPTTGVDYSRFGAEIAIAIAKGCGATNTALNISAPPPENELLRRPNQLLRVGRALLGDVVDLGEREGVLVRSKAFVGAAKAGVILRQASLGKHDLIVLGTKASSGDQLSFGSSARALIAKAPCPILIVKS